MELLLVLVLAVLVVIAVLLYRLLRSGSGAKPAPRPSTADPLARVEDRVDIRTARVGDMIDYLAVTYFVRGSLRIKEGGFTWVEHFLDDARGRRIWLSVEEDPDVEVVLWEELTGSGLVPAEREMTVQDVTYRRVEHGTARYTTEGTTGVGQDGSTGTVEYVDFDGPKGRFLSFERFDGGEWEVGLGEEMLLSAITLYPSGDRPS